MHLHLEDLQRIQNQHVWHLVLVTNQQSHPGFPGIWLPRRMLPRHMATKFRDKAMDFFSNRILQKANEQISFIERSSYSVREGSESTKN